ncbi:MAG: cyclic-di-AMP receptor, partial [Clostridia bacterium]|nr:cyclic-di-AMP receptor [Clostridia bacterium]
VGKLKEILGEYCSTRTKSMPSTDAFGRINGPQNTPKNVVVGGATYFVLDVNEFGKL